MNEQKPGAALYFVSPEKLTPHPLLEQHFQPGTEEELSALEGTVSEISILHPLVANKAGQILSGRDRWTAAKRLNLKTVPVRFLDFKRQEHEEVAIIAANVCVRALSPSTVKRTSERMEEVLAVSRNGKNGVDGLLAGADSAVKRNVKKIAAEAERKGKDLGYEEAARTLKAKIDRVEGERRKLQDSMEELIKERDKYAKQLDNISEEREQEKNKLSRQINALKEERQKQEKTTDKEITLLQKEVKRLTERMGKSVDKLDSESAPGPKERKLMGLAIQLSRVGPETVIPCLVDMLARKDRKQEIIDALKKTISWCNEMQQLLQ